MKASVTGGSGVVGSAVVRHLVDAGHEVRALSRSARSTATFASIGVEPVGGDLGDQDSLNSLVAGADVVFHIAGVNEMCSTNREWMWRVNVGGTRAVMTACKAEGVPRLVHTSSAVTIGESKGVVGNEWCEHRGFFLSDYERSKVHAEQVALKEADGLDVVAVNPSSVQGPGRSTGTGRIFLAAAGGKLPLLFDTTVSLVDIDDCARGHLLAAEHGVSGERYLLSGAVIEMRAAMRLLAGITGRRLSPRYLRPGVVRGVAAFLEAAYGLSGRQPPLCREAARVMLHGHRYDGSRATRELGLRYTPVEETIRRSVAWFRSQNLLT